MLSATRDRLAALDRRLGNDVAEYRAIYEALAPLPEGPPLQPDEFDISDERSRPRGRPIMNAGTGL